MEKSSKIGLQKILDILRRAWYLSCPLESPKAKLWTIGHLFFAHQKEAFRNSYLLFSSARHRHLETQRLAIENLVGHHFHLRIQWSPFSSIWSDGWIRRYRTSFCCHLFGGQPGMSGHCILFRAACGRGKSADFPADMDHHRRNEKECRIWIRYRRYGGCGRSASLRASPSTYLILSPTHCVLKIPEKCFIFQHISGEASLFLQEINDTRPAR